MNQATAPLDRIVDSGREAVKTITSGANDAAEKIKSSSRQIKRGVTEMRTRASEMGQGPKLAAAALVGAGVAAITTYALLKRDQETSD